MYRESRAKKKYLAWKLMRILHNQASLPWLCVGDFNEVLLAKEKEGGREKDKTCMDKFKEALDFCGLEDLGFEGDKFTWRNNNHRWENYIQERFDRAVANEGWRNRFEDYRVVNGDQRHSDHMPIIIYMEKGERRRPREGGHQGKGGSHAFKFEARWLKEENCDKLVKEA
ncbi:Retrotransposon protein [Hordeum vulgare]|nr:Retrotransposon protein [Hordeum vulgare]